MNKKELQIEIRRRLSNGENKSHIFQSLRGQEFSDHQIAYMIASYAHPERCVRYAKLTKAMVMLAWLQLGLSALVSFWLGMPLGLIGRFVIVGIAVGVSYLFVWGFSRNKVWAYNVTILCTIINLPKSLAGFSQAPIITVVSLLLAFALLAFTIYVRSMLFPDFAFLAVRRNGGAYVFSS